MKYPEVLGYNIKLLPTKYRSAEWFESLPQEIHRQFYWTVNKYGLEVAAEYLNDNHGCDGNHELKRIKKRASKFGEVRGLIYANNMLQFFWDDGPQYHRITRDPSRWLFVGYVDVGDTRVIRASRVSNDARTKLNVVVKNAIASGVSRLGISRPLIFNLTLSVAEDIREVAGRGTKNADRS